MGRPVEREQDKKGKRQGPSCRSNHHIHYYRGRKVSNETDSSAPQEAHIIFRALYKVYGYTRKWTERFLTWAEDSILEVN
jgi:hypothetical protein